MISFNAHAENNTMASQQEEPRPQGVAHSINEIGKPLVSKSVAVDPEIGSSGRAPDPRALQRYLVCHLARDHAPTPFNDSLIPIVYHLTSLMKGESEVEILADRIETQRAERIPVTRRVRLDFLRTCRAIADGEDCPNFMIPESRLIALRDGVQDQVDARKQADSHMRKFFTYLGFLDEQSTMLEILNRAVERVDDTDDDFIHYQDFSFYNTRLISRWPWMRYPTSVAVCIMLLFYLFTPVWFCHILPDENVCPSDPDTDREGGPRSYYGWLTSLYFASTSMSTVGYGDVSVSKDTRGYVFVGIAYMIVALLVAVTAFSAAADNAFSKFGDWNEKIVSFLTGNLLEGNLLHEKMRKLKVVKLTDIFFQFLLLNVIGMFLARFFVRSDPEWTWMTTFYWAVQTTTTVGRSVAARVYISR